MARQIDKKRQGWARPLLEYLSRHDFPALNGIRSAHSFWMTISTTTVANNTRSDLGGDISDQLESTQCTYIYAAYTT
jgi:hypothetical protein